MPRSLLDPTQFSHNNITIHLDREPRWYDSQIRLSPKNPRWFDLDAATQDTVRSDAEWARDFFGAMTTERLYELLDGPFLLLVDGQCIRDLLFERGVWDESQIGSTSTFLECRCSVCTGTIRAAMNARDDHSLTRIAA